MLLLPAHEHSRLGIRSIQLTPTPRTSVSIFSHAHAASLACLNACHAAAVDCKGNTTWWRRWRPPTSWGMCGHTLAAGLRRCKPGMMPWTASLGPTRSPAIPPFSCLTLACHVKAQTAKAEVNLGSRWVVMYGVCAELGHQDTQIGTDTSCHVHSKCDFKRQSKLSEGQD